MSYTAPDLADDIESLLKERGYTIEGEADDASPNYGPRSWHWSRNGERGEPHNSQHAALMDAVQHMAKAAELAALNRPKWAKAAGLHTWAFVTDDPFKQGAVFACSHSNDWRGRAIIGSSDTEQRHPSMIAAMCWVEEELKGTPAETEEERKERAFQEARAKWDKSGDMMDLCAAIEAGYAAEMSIGDDDMLAMAQELADRTDAIRGLVMAARGALEWMSARGVVADERVVLHNTLRAFEN
jgi:hypothetical protein